MVAGVCALGLRMYVTAMPGKAMLAMAGHHIKTNSIGLQCLV